LVLADLPQGADASSVSPLSVRERQVLGLLARGLTDRQVAEELVISPKTVEKHVGAVLRKTGTTSRTAAVVRALEDGWLPPVGRLPAG
jgi:DNA-binding NarL/FixJ family response regulator